MQLSQPKHMLKAPETVAMVPAVMEEMVALALGEMAAMALAVMEERVAPALGEMAALATVSCTWLTADCKHNIGY